MEPNIIKEVGSTLSRALSAITADFGGHFEDQRRDFGKSIRIKNDCLAFSKDIIELVKTGEYEKAYSLLESLDKLVESLQNLNIPQDKMWEVRADVEQEWVEAWLVYMLAHVLFEESAMPKDLPSLKTTRQSYLAGLGDVPSELGKIISFRFRNPQLTKAGRIQILTIYLEVSDTILKTLKEFRYTYPLVINNSRWKGDRNKFSGKIRGVERVIMELEQQFSTLLVS